MLKSAMAASGWCIVIWISTISLCLPADRTSARVSLSAVHFFSVATKSSFCELIVHRIPES